MCKIYTPILSIFIIKKPEPQPYRQISFQFKNFGSVSVIILQEEMKMRKILKTRDCFCEIYK